MPIYSKPSEQLVYDLINQDNPTLPVALSPSNVSLSNPSVYSPGSGIANSQIRVSGIPNSYYIGSKQLSYRRIAFADLFKGVSIEIKKYSAASVSAVPFTLYQLLSDINTKYGLSLTEDDIIDANFPIASDNVYPERTCKVSMVANANSKAFVGSVDVRWRWDEPYLANIAPNTDLDGRLYPGGNDFSSGTKYRITSEAYGIDFSTLAATLNSAAFNTGVSIGNANYVTQQQTVFDLLNQITGKTYSSASANQNTAYGMYGATCTRYSLPNAAIPQADSTYYNTIVVITLPDNNTWGVGQLMIHYNT